MNKRISTYLYELVHDPEKMDEYWRNKKEALAKSGLTPPQQRILLEQDHAAMLEAMHREYVDSPEPLVGEFHWPVGPPGPGTS